DHDVRRRAGRHRHVGVHRFADPDLSRRRLQPHGRRCRGARAAGAAGRRDATTAREDAPLVEAPHLPRQALIDAHGGGGFRFAGMSHRGSLLCLPDGIWAWPVTQPAQAFEETLARVFAQTGELDFFVFGTGAAPWMMPEPLRARFRAAQVSLDTMTTGAAVRTYNV